MSMERSVRRGPRRAACCGLVLLAVSAGAAAVAPSATSLTVHANGGVIGEMVTASVVVSSPTASIGGPRVAPTGTVVVGEGSTSCTATLDTPGFASNSGSCSLPLSACGAATCDVTATYGGDDVYASSSSEPPVPISIGVVGATLSPAEQTIPRGASAIYTATLVNATASDASVTKFIVEVPPGINALEGIATTCGAGSSINLTPTAIILNGGVIPASGQCTLQFGAAGPNGSYAFVIDEDDLQTSAGDNVTESDGDLEIVDPIPPTVALAFSPGTIAAGGTSTLTITLGNPNPTSLLFAGFSDSLPAGLVVADPPAATTNCPASKTDATAGQTFVNVGFDSIGTVTSTIPPGSCTATVSVTAAHPGTYVDAVPAGAVLAQTTSPPDAGIVGIADNSVAAASATLIVNAATGVSAVPVPGPGRWALAVLAAGLVILGRIASRRRQGS